MTMPSTASELNDWTRSCYSNMFPGGLGPCPVGESDLGWVLESKKRSIALDEPLRRHSEFSNLLGISLKEDGSQLGKLSAFHAMEKNIAAFQEQNLISGVIERRVVFKPLGLNIIVLEKGFCLSLIGDDSLKIRLNAQAVARAVSCLANGAGKSWLRYREVKTELDDGQQTYRFVRDDWESIEKSIATTTACFISTTIGLDLGIGIEEAIELQLVEDELNEDNFSWLLVHPTRERNLSNPDLRWLS